MRSPQAVQQDVRANAFDVDVALGARSYRVVVGAGLLDSLGRFVADRKLAGACAVITDSNVAKIHAPRAEKSLAAAGFKPLLLEVPAGESSKSMAQAGELCERMIAAGLDRHAFIIALGGGVVGDLTGFVAAIYFRGIPYVQAPTTVVAQVDSAVGGKTGVNAARGKNLIGSFHQPRLVVADVETLQTLPEREFNEGFAEIIKHAIIRDRELFDSLENFDRPGGAALAPLIARNVAIKASIVSADEHETTGERALLNFGHTAGHAIENAAGYGRYLHGEAISLGIIAACALSVRKAGLAQSENDAIVARLRQFKLPTRLPADIPTDAIMSALRTDKKFAGGNVRFVLSPAIGSAFVSKDVTLDEIRDAIEGLR
jgi:3-dehydroquinate synthase